jgi:uncharacterized protein YndB with AHSA1/START domain
MLPIIRTIQAALAARGRSRPGRDAEPDLATVHIHQELQVAAPPERVFELVRDIEWLPAWNPHLEMRHVSGPLDRVGTTFDTTLKMLGLQFPGTGSVVEAEPGRLVHLRVDCTGAHGGTSDWIYRFPPEGEGTRCSVDLGCTESGGAMLLMLERVFGRHALTKALERIAGQQLENLAALAEQKVSQPG